MFDVPAVAMDHDLFERLVAREDRRQHDAVVVHPRLGVEDRHVKGIGRGFEQPLQGAAGRHSVADDDESLLRVRGHRVHPTNKQNAQVIALDSARNREHVGGTAEYPSLGEALETGHHWPRGTGSKKRANLQNMDTKPLRPMTRPGPARKHGKKIRV